VFVKALSCIRLWHTISCRNINTRLSI